MTVLELRKRFCAPAKKSLPLEDFFVLLSHASGKEKSFLIAHEEHELDEDQTAKAIACMKRRADHEPVALILGQKEFFGNEFRVTEDTLVPRPETELIVEKALALLSRCVDTALFADIGTGSGSIAISVAKALQKNSPERFAATRFFATDISERALTVAKGNAAHHGLKNALTFSRGDLLEPITEAVESENDLLVIAANLPYLSQEIYESSPDDVKRFEPKSALWSSKKGLDHYYRLLDQIKSLALNNKRSVILMEISPEQSALLHARTSTLFAEASFEISKDLAGKDRVATLSF